MVNVTDSSGNAHCQPSRPSIVTIDVLALDEKPIFRSGSSTIEHVEGTTLLDRES